MSIRTKLALSLGVLIVIIAALISTASISLTSVNSRMASIVADRVLPLEQLKAVADGYAVAIVDNAHKVRSGVISFEEGRTILSTAELDIASKWSAYLATKLTDEEVVLADAAAVAMTNAEPDLNDLRALLASQDMPGLEAFVADRLYPAMDPIGNAISSLVILQVNVARSEYKSAEVLFSQITLVMTGMAIASILAVLHAGFVITRTVSARLRNMRTVLLEVAGGDYHKVIPSAGDRDEIGGIAQAAETFRQNGLKIAELTEAEADQALMNAAARRQMMTDLSKAFSAVVDASVEGDFSQRVAADFPDQELNKLANSVNHLVETVDRGLTETGAVLSALANANLTLRVEGRYQGSFDRLKSDVNAVADKLVDIVGQLRTTSGSVRTATGEILAGANDLAERTTRQAAAIEQTSAAMEQLSHTVIENAGRADQASGKSRSVAANAEQTSSAMSEANLAMERISSSSAAISSIIGVIDDIAFQTNLLALNASVEAARAGDAGKGFAVVAVEVRRLAQSAAQASSEVKVLIERSGGEVQTGSKLVTGATNHLLMVLAGVRENAVLIADIAAASQTQSSAISEMTAAIRQMDEMTQHNAALVEETNAAIEQTEAQATELDQIVDIFVLDDKPIMGLKRGVGNALSPRVATPRAIPTATKMASGSRNYLSQGSAALKTDWSEF